MNSKSIILTVASVVAAAAGAAAIPAAPFADNMVLQRGMRVPVWGTAQPGENVTVSFAGQTKCGIAGTDGRWRVDLDPMAASKESRTLVIGERQGEGPEASALSLQQAVDGFALCRRLRPAAGTV